MSIDSLRQFRQKANADEKLQQAMREHVNVVDTAWVVALGKEHGFDFTEGELRQELRSRELSDFELEMVSGGVTDQRQTSRHQEK